jgi:hypothetical protein
MTLDAESSTPSDAIADGNGAGAAAIGCVTLALLAFPIAFNLGAYDVVLYPDVFRIIVAACALVCVSFFSPTYTGRRLWFTRVVLAAPALWVAGAVVVLGSTADATDDPVFIVWLVGVMVVSVPVTLLMLLDMFSPDLASHRNRQITVLVTVVVIIVALAGYLAGANNDRIMTCADFAIAGSAEPEGCVS